MSPNPSAFLAHLQSKGYHPRSDKHSNALAEAIAADLVEHCSRIRERAAAGEIVYDLNVTIAVGTTDWNIDLVLGSPALGTAQPIPPIKILRSPPSSIEVAVELKSVMTEHRKAVRNRKRDLEAHHEHLHHYSNSAIAGGVLVINASPTFKSPLRPQTDTTIHKNPNILVKHCVDQLRGVTGRSGREGQGLEAKCAIIVSTDNVTHTNTRYVTTPPAPQIGDPLHYDAFIQTICREYSERH